MGGVLSGSTWQRGAGPGAAWGAAAVRSICAGGCGSVLLHVSAQVHLEMCPSCLKKEWLRAVTYI